jgi:hypothetical protein
MKYKYKIEINVINLIILFYLFRTTIPLLKFPFLFLYIIYTCYAIISYRKRIASAIVAFGRSFYLLIILGLILLISTSFSDKLYLSMFKDSVNMIILLSVFFLAVLVINGRRIFTFFVSNLITLIVIFAFFICIFRLLAIFDIFYFGDISQIKESSYSYSSESFSYDYNFALIPVFFGISGILYLSRNANNKIKIVSAYLLLILFSLNIILSGSRRGLLLLIIIFIILVLVKMILLIKNHKFIKDFHLSFRLFFISFISTIALLYLFFFNASHEFKDNALKFFGTKNVTIARFTISKNLFRYVSALNGKKSLTEFNEKLWTLVFNPNDPETGWGSRIHKTMFPLTGNGVEMVPLSAKGYLMDSTCNSYPEKTYCDSYSLLTDLVVSNGDKFSASVYCYVSEDFDGDIVRFGVGTDIITNGVVFGKPIAYYDLGYRGIWKKLEIDFECKTGYVPIYLSFVKNGVKDFSKLKGYVIFAYPQYQKSIDSINTLPLSFYPNSSDYANSGFDYYIFIKLYQRRCKPLYHTRKSKIFDTDLHKSDEIIIQNKVSSSLCVLEQTKKEFYSSIFINLKPVLYILNLIQNDKDPIRNLTLKVISEDTIYYPYKTEIILDKIANPFFGDRILRWEFAIKLFKNEFNWRQKIIGGGFSFLNWYGYFFLQDKTISDYPHNPFLSILLYSGILGLLIYCFFIFKIFNYYLKYRKEYPLLFVFFLITFFFSFFSAGSPFDPPIMGFFSILPFFIHYVHKNDESASGIRKIEFKIP